MKRVQQFTAIIEREGDGYVSLCPELDIASEGNSVESAKNNLIEALELFFEVADRSEIESRLHTDAKGLYSNRFVGWVEAWNPTFIMAQVVFLRSRTHRTIRLEHLI